MYIPIYVARANKHSAVREFQISIRRRFNQRNDIKNVPNPKTKMHRDLDGFSQCACMVALKNNGSGVVKALRLVFYGAI